MLLILLISLNACAPRPLSEISLECGPPTYFGLFIIRFLGSYIRKYNIYVGLVFRNSYKDTCITLYIVCFLKFDYLNLSNIHFVFNILHYSTITNHIIMSLSTRFENKFSLNLYEKRL